MSPIICRMPRHQYVFDKLYLTPMWLGLLMVHLLVWNWWGIVLYSIAVCLCLRSAAQGVGALRWSDYQWHTNRANVMGSSNTRHQWVMVAVAGLVEAMIGVMVMALAHKLTMQERLAASACFFVDLSLSLWCWRRATEQTANLEVMEALLQVETHD